MKSKAQIDREIKSARINCNTYVGAWNHNTPGVRTRFPKKEDIVSYFDNIINKLQTERAEIERINSGAIVQQALEKAATTTNSNVEVAPQVVAPIAETPKPVYNTTFQRKDRQLNIELRNWQQATADNVFTDLYYHNMAAQMILSGVGSGKTFMVGSVIQRLLDAGWAREKVKSIAPFPIVVVTKATVVEQFSSDLEYRFGIDINGGEILVTNYEQLRSKFGAQFIQEKTIVKNGEPEIIYRWKQFVHPALIVWDEAHSLKNESSTQSRIAMACNVPELDGKLFQIFMSATPFTRISDCKCFTTACRMEI